MTVSKDKVENNKKLSLPKKQVLKYEQNAGAEKYRNNLKKSFQQKIIEDYKNDENQGACYTLESSTCPVCMNEYTKKRDWYTINPCGHCICKFCADVLFDYGKLTDRWDWNDKFTFRNKCPICMNRIYWNTQFTVDDGFFVIQNYKHLNHHIMGIIERNISKFKIGPLSRGLKKGYGRLPYDPIFLQLSKKEIDSQKELDKGLTKKTFKVESIQLIDYNYYRLSDEIQGLKQLRELMINSSKLKNLSNGFPSLKSLNKLKISNAKGLKELPIINNNNISTLHIENCKSLFSNKNDSVFNFINNCKNLSHLILTKNEISSINMSVFSNVDRIMKLQSLMLHDNDLSSLPDNIINAYNLRNISIASNKFNEFPDTFKRFDFLERLYISGNNIKHIPKQIYELKHIQFMHVAKIPNINISKYMNAKIKTLEAPIFHDDKVVILSWNNEPAPPVYLSLNINMNDVKPIPQKDDITLLRQFKSGNEKLDSSITTEEQLKIIVQSFDKKKRTMYNHVIRLLREHDKTEYLYLQDEQNEKLKESHNDLIMYLNAAKNKTNADMQNKPNDDMQNNPNDKKTKNFYDKERNKLNQSQKDFLNQLDNTFPTGKYKQWLKPIVTNVIEGKNKNKDLKGLTNSFRVKCLELVLDKTKKDEINSVHNPFHDTFKDSNRLTEFMNQININRNNK
jgi:hypothetical protein